jgi:hypothetical protein
MNISDDAILAAMEAGGNEARAWSSIDRGGKVLVHDLKRVAQIVDFDMSKALPHHVPLERHVFDDKTEAVSFVSFRVYKAAIEAAINYQPENDHEADQSLRDRS